MRFNRAIGSIDVLSFDLDDTLYNNHPIIKGALQAQFDYLASIAKWQAEGPEYWQQCRANIIAQQPDLINDVTQLRQAALLYGFKTLGFSDDDATMHADMAYQAFSKARSNITVSNDVLNLLAMLRQHFKLIAITNGNVDVTRFNLNNEFEFVLLAGPDGAAKPHSELFTNAAKKLNVNVNKILHIGDSLDSDVQGANNAGCHSVWLNNQNIKYNYQGLADIEIKDIQQLRSLAP